MYQVEVIYPITTKWEPFYTSYYETCVCFKVSRSLEKR